MRQLRKIVVDGVKYRWLFRYDDYDYCSPSYLLFLPAGIPHAEIRMIFREKQDKFLLNEGLPAVKDDKLVQINLNQPGYAAELLKFCLQQKVDFYEKQRWEFDGDAALRKLGYDTSLDTQ